ncbi:MAG: hypothetical protein HY814_12490, partial [Candidatus Riflebacteria bacterium]|nr:hypothetical protein [Candidatus Riflebacteria bacterium]
MWNVPPTGGFQPADLVLGQPSPVTNTENNGGLSASTLSWPSGVATNGTHLLVADSGNHRVLLWTQPVTATQQTADLVLGQPSFGTSTVNNGGRSASSMNGPVGAASDGSRCYVADAGNNRVLAWTRPVTATRQPADLVLGQPSFGTSTENNGGLSAAGLSSPLGVACDGARLFVADDGNRRVTVWTSMPTGNQQPATGVAGQSSLRKVAAGCSPFNIGTPSSTVVAGGILWVADTDNDRVVGYKLENDLTVAMTYSGPGSIVGQGPLVITATFSAALVTTPTISIDRPGPGNDVTAVAMTATADPAVWTYIYMVTAYDGGPVLDGPTTVTIAGARDAAGNENHAAENATFTVDTQPPTITLTAAAVARRQEPALGPVEPTPVTVTVTNPAGAAPVRVDSVGLAFTIATTAADSQYDTTAPALPVTVTAGTSVELVLQVQPKSSAKVFEPVTLTATVLATDLGTSQQDTLKATATWSVTPGATIVLGQVDAFSSEKLRRGEYRPQNVFCDGTRLAIADTSNNRVLIWNQMPSDLQAVPDVVLGQPGFETSGLNTGGRRAGLREPRGLASDGTRLFVADNSNHRVLVWNSFPTVHGQPADLVLGQPDLDTGTQNNGGVSASSLNGPCGVATNGTQLFVVDSGNNRVLVWNLPITQTQQPADLVLGQPDFSSTSGATSATALKGPDGVACDGSRLFVADVANSRVLVWAQPITATQQPADVVLGQPNFGSSTQNQGGRSASSLCQPHGVASDGTRLFVADWTNNRVLAWTQPITATQQPADLVLGQPDFASGAANLGGVHDSSLDSPYGVACDGTRLFVADLDNNRVLAWTQPITVTHQAADLVLGQPDFLSNAANDVGAKPWSLLQPLRVASDGTRLFVTDKGNHRVLVWNHLPLANEQPADLVLGQPDPGSRLANNGGVSASSLKGPDGAFGDAARLFVSDGGNHRVLAWTRPLTATGQAADLVLGQPDFASSLTNSGSLGASSLATPGGVASDGLRLFVADNGNNRVLMWNGFPAANQQAADLVLGQRDFTSNLANGPGLGASSLSGPGGFFAGVRLFVADVGNNRVLAWNGLPMTSGQPADLVLGQRSFSSGTANEGGLGAAGTSHPAGVSSDGTRLFVVDQANHRVLAWNRIPAANGLPATGVVGQQSMASSAAGAFTPYTLSGPSSSVVAGGILWVVDSGHDRVLGFKLSHGLTVALGYSRPVGTVTSGPLVITATFSEPLVTGPTIAVDRPGTGNDVSAVAMTATSDPAVWTYTYLVAGHNGTTVLDGPVTVTIAGGLNGSGVENETATAATFTTLTRPMTVVLTAAEVALRREVGIPATPPTTVTVGVRNNSDQSSLRVDAVGLSFTLGGLSADRQYEVTSPGLPSTILPGGTRTFTLQVRPKPGASLFESVTLTAVVTATDLGTSVQGTETATTAWTVSPGATIVLGQFDGYSQESLRRGLNKPEAVWTDGTRLVVADTPNHRVLVWNQLPGSNHAAPDLVLGQPNLSSNTANNGGVSAWSLQSPRGVASDGTRLLVGDDNSRVLIWNSFPTSNGQAADLVLGQPDFTSNAHSNGGVSASSLSGSQRVATDGTRLFVSDYNNSRVLVWNSFPTTNRQPADLVLGQPDFAASSDNNGGISAVSLCGPAGVACAGTKLLVADYQNKRVLIWNSFPTTNRQPADLVLGPSNFTSAGSGVGTPRLDYSDGVATDGTRVFVADGGNNHRVLVWTSIPTANGQPADLVLGQPDFTSRTNNNGGLSGSSLFEPKGVAIDGTRLVVADTSNYRVLVWNILPVTNKQPADLVIGQSDFASRASNSGGALASSLNRPWGLATDGVRFFVADRSNNRVLVWNGLPTTSGQPADLVMGQPGFGSSAADNGGGPAASLDLPCGVASDGTRLYVADENNNRVLIWNGSPTTNGQPADLVLGQPDFGSSTANNGGCNSASLARPLDVASDGARLFVADRDNNRVLLWNSLPTLHRQAADLVLGQPSFGVNTENTGGVSASSLLFPCGVTADGTRLLVVDENHRVLVWSSMPVANQQPAGLAVGQPDFTSSAYGSGTSRLRAPQDAASDGTRLFVADRDHNRVLVWAQSPTATGQPATGVIGQVSLGAGVAGGYSPYALSGPVSLVVAEGVLWVADCNHDRVLGFRLDGLSVALSYSKPVGAVTSGPLVITATFGDALVTTPNLAIDRPGTGNDVAATPMAATTDPAVWTYAYLVAGYDGSAVLDGTARVTITGGRNDAAHSNAPATNARFTVDTAAVNVSLTHSRAGGIVGVGPLFLTATFSQPIVTVPTVSIDRPGDGNDVVAAPMTATGDPRMWTYTYWVVIGDSATSVYDGFVSVTVANGRDAGGHENAPATGATFTTETRPPTLTAFTNDIVRRQEPKLPAVDPTPVTLTVKNESGTASLRVDSASLTFAIEGSSVDSQYTVTPPALPVTIPACATQTFVYLVRPKPSATVFEPVGLTATLTAVNLGTGQRDTVAAQMGWSVTPGATIALGQVDTSSLETLRRGEYSPEAVWTDGTRLAIADTYNSRVLFWHQIPSLNHAVPDVVLGQPDLGSSGDNRCGLSASSLNFPSGIATDGTRLFVADTNNHRVLVWSSFPTRNGQPADLVLGQSSFSSNGQGLGSSSLTRPRGLVWAGGRLFVADYGNSRVLIWTQPITAMKQPADLVLGQSNLSSGNSNSGGLSASSLYAPYDVASDGTRLLVADNYNHRVLVWSSFPTANKQPADLVLGQPNFTSNTSNNGGRSASSLAGPQGVASDGTRLFVGDGGNHRVLVWGSFPTANGQVADLVLGQPDFTSGTGGTSALGLCNPYAVESDGARLFVADSSNCRVLAWTQPITATRQPADLVLGQPTFTSGGYNNAGSLAAWKLRQPWGLASDGTRLFVADSGNHRVSVWNSLPATSGQVPDLFLGQPSPLSNTANNGGLSASSLSAPYGLACDGTRLFVADKGNNRVSVWSSAPTTTGQAADLFLGQPSALTSTANNGGLGASSLSAPYGVACDGTRLVVADKGNNRVSIWNSFPTTTGQVADLFLGQLSPMTNTANGEGRTGSSLSSPYGVALDATRLFTADNANNRVLIWDSFPMTTGQTAALVLGQPDFGSGLPDGAASSASSMTGPDGVASDGTRLFVADNGNNRVTVWPVGPMPNGQPAAGLVGQTGMGTQLTECSPYGLSGPVSSLVTGGILWVADYGNDRVVGFRLTNGPEVVLAYSKPDSAVSAGILAITATFGRPLVTTPSIAVNRPGTGNDVTATPLQATGDSAVWTYTYTVLPQDGSTILDGSTTVTIAGGKDAAGYENLPAEGSVFVVDTTPPAVVLTYNQTARRYDAETFRVTATFSEPIGPAAPTLQLAGGSGDASNDVTPTAMSGGGAVWTYTRTVAGGSVDDGSFEVTLTAGDAAGNPLAAQPAERTFTIDTAAPQAVLTYSKASRAYRAETFTVTATFSEPLTPAAPSLELAGGSVDSSNDVAPTTMSGGGTVWTYTRTVVGGSVDDGSFTITLTAFDTTGTPLAAQPAGRTFTVDTTGPAVVLTYNNANRAYRAELFVITATFSEPITQAAPTVELAGGSADPSNDVPPTAMSGGGTVWTFARSVAGLGLDDGTFEITLTAFDPAGNPLTAQPAKRTFTVDTAAPAAVLTYSQELRRVGGAARR